MKITYTNTLPTVESFFVLFQSTGWNDAHPRSAAQLHTGIQHSWYVVSAYDENKLVGFGRILSDGILHALIVELIVLPDYQGRGIGSTILNNLVAECKAHNIYDVQLFCAQGKSGFYEKYGFEKRPSDAPGMQLRKN
jgi:ribosomal protein S18 acetylase RimI-like enzyme